jgi:hypothetical protein
MEKRLTEEREISAVAVLTPARRLLLDSRAGQEAGGGGGEGTHALADQKRGGEGGGLGHSRHFLKGGGGRRRGAVGRPAQGCARWRRWREGGGHPARRPGPTPGRQRPGHGGRGRAA